jgi:hypothetical protein
MITLKEYFELIEYRVTEGSDYGWDCYGPDTHMISSWNGIHDKGGYSFNCVFDTNTQTVYEVEVCDYTNSRAYRMINPDYADKHRAEALDREIDLNQAWDDVNYVDLDVVDDFIQKCLAIRAGEEYDTRVSMPLTLDDDRLFDLMKLAHEKDVTLNTLVEQMLQEFIAVHGDNAMPKKKKKKKHRN